MLTLITAPGIPASPCLAHERRDAALFGRRSPAFGLVSVTGRARSRRAARSRRRCHDGLRTGGQFEGQAEREGCRYVVEALAAPRSPSPAGGDGWAAATIERPSDPHVERRLHRGHGGRQRRYARYRVKSRVVVGAVRVLAEGYGPAPDSLWINSLGWTTALPDWVRDHRSPVGNLARRLGGRAGEPEVSARGRSGRRAERSGVERPAGRVGVARLDPRTRSPRRTQESGRERQGVRADRRVPWGLQGPVPRRRRLVLAALVAPAHHARLSGHAEASPVAHRLCSFPCGT